MQSPVHVGVYSSDYRLIHVFSVSKPTNFALSEIFEALLEWIKERCYQIQALYYARGPGSFMAMKLTHVFMHTWALLNPVPLYSTLGFAFNQHAPIKAFGKMYYVLSQEQVTLCALESVLEIPMSLPPVLDSSVFCTNNQPLYLLPPV
ncbi:hypothetical protein HSUHS5_0152 [Helicobacter suis HS5]|uniref:TsaB protein, required for threonylcarbamoyladenosine (T(6)A) formation in tRNA n=1 Tax=Helicobacter suis HS5 TaxID=710394 RepID=E7G2L2_9HELI|nr:hypothetical protein [Helicobacter suis]EFX42361.1 hypothetical protein HSUHS5_0152 [Helicobacter suis HS5]EFX43098.1 hypothetical protein HSUHS1_0579 [Helicobacter suis HS1]